MDRIPMAQDLAWPNIVRPRRPILYLDLNHFIGMARAIDGDPSTPPLYMDLYKASRVAVEEKRVTIPLSNSLFREVAAIKDPRQRQKIADVMEALSGFQYLLGRVEIAQLEIIAGIKAVYSEQPDAPVPLIGPSFGWSFGLKGGLKLKYKDGRGDASAHASQMMGKDAYTQIMQRANHMMERRMLEGPSDEEDATLRAEYDYAPEIAQRGTQSRLEFELDLSQRLAEHPRWRRGRLRDVISAREISHERLDAILRINQERLRMEQPALDLGDEKGKQFIAAMPHSQVAISIKTRYHRDPSHHWTTNDITDIDAISVAYAYCDVVFTDKAVRAALVDSRDLRRFRTLLPRTLNELIRWIKDQPALISADLLIPHPPKDE